MARYEKKCCICQKKITAQFWVCSDCEIEHDLAYPNGKQKPPREWPDWARSIYNMAQNERYAVVEKKVDRAFEYDDEADKEANADPYQEFDDYDEEY